MKPLYKLIYSSIRQPDCSDEDIIEILNACERNNRNTDVTGVLLHSDYRFIQYLEGSSEQVVNLYDKIRTDSRHKDAVIRSYASIERRIFPSWHMGYRSLDNVEFNSDINPGDKAIFESLITGVAEDGNLGVSLIKNFFQRERP